MYARWDLRLPVPQRVDDFATGESQSADAPFGHVGERLHEWMFGTHDGAAGQRWSVRPAENALNPEMLSPDNRRSREGRVASHIAHEMIGTTYAESAG